MKPRTRMEQDKKWSLWNEPGTPETRNQGTPQSGTCDAKAGKSPGGALVHPCPRQYVIQPMRQIFGKCWAGDRRSNRRKSHRAAVQRATATPATTVHPVCRARAARSGSALNDRNKMRIQSTTRSTSGIRWFLRSILEPVDYSQYTMPQHSQRIAGSTSIQWLSSLWKKSTRIFILSNALQIATGNGTKQ